MRIAFLGTPPFAVPSLEALLQSGEEVVAVLTQPDRPAGRGRHPQPSAVKRAARQAGLPVHQPERVRDPAVLELLLPLQLDLIVVVAFGQILPQSLLDLPTHGCVNVHASLLPRYRGAAPIPRAILHGETETGITTIRMDAGIDTGPIFLQRACHILPDDTAGTLAMRLASLGAEVLVETLRALKAGALRPQPQDDRRATYAPLLKKEEGWLRWEEPAVALRDRVRAFDPWPGAYTSRQGTLLKIWRAAVVPGAVGTPGNVLRAGKEGILVATGEGGLLMTEIQLPGGQRMSASAFLRGHPLQPGERLGGE